MEKIELRIAPAAFGFHGHLFIIYTNRSGEEFIVRGGPGAGSILDDIDVEIGPYTPASRDWKAPEDRSEDDNILLEEGPDLEAKFLKMAFFAQLVEQSQIDYDTMTAAWNNDSDLIVNSNTLVAGALASAGIYITGKDLPVSAKRLPPAGYKNTSALQQHFNAFFAENYGLDASQGDQKSRAIYDRLETVYLDRYRGKLSELSNFTNGGGTPEYPKIIFEGVDWRATEDHIRETFSDNPALAVSILAELATARTLKGDWETEFLQKFGDYAVFENSPASGSVTRGSITNVPAGVDPDHSANKDSNQPTDLKSDQGAAIGPGQPIKAGLPVSQMHAAANGASREELTDQLLQRAEESDPAPLVEPDFRDPDLKPERVLEGEAPLSSVEQISGSDPILPPSFSPGLPGADSRSGGAEVPAQGAGFNGEAPAGAEGLKQTDLSFSPATGNAAQAGSGMDLYARKTSYDRDRKLGRTPEEEAEAFAEFEDLLREAYVVTGNMPMAHGMASAQLQVNWGSSVFAAEEGTVMKYPVEKAYTDLEKDGYGFVRSEAESLLASAGIKAQRWYLEPNGKTAGDRFRGSMDEDGYGPRMTLSYDDEAGNRHVVTEGFQAHVAGARQRRQAAEDKDLRELAEEYGIEWPEPPEVDPFQAVRDGFAREASFPELRKKAQEKRGRAADAERQPAPAPLTRPLPDVQPMPKATTTPYPAGQPPQGGNQTSQYHQGGANRPFSLPGGD